MPKFIITQKRTEDYQAEVEADTEDEAWEMLNAGEVEFEFLESDDEFEISPK